VLCEYAHDFAHRFGTSLHLRVFRVDEQAALHAGQVGAGYWHDSIGWAFAERPLVVADYRVNANAVAVRQVLRRLQDLAIGLKQVDAGGNVAA
jgi:hypothetical protein